MKRLLIYITAFLIGAILILVPVTGSFSTACPSIEALRSYQPPEASHVYALDRSLIADLSPQRRTVVELDQIPEVVKAGFIAVEDRRFWSHHGVDLRGVGRAVWRDLTSLSFREGFSTIQMQLARNIFPDELPRAKRIGRKVCEIKLAFRMGQQLSREEVLGLYLNQVYLGDGRYGVEEAARGYFGHPISEVSTAEAALLIGLVQGPERLNPRKHPDRAIRRRDLVLSVMMREGVIDREAARRARSAPLDLAPPAEALTAAPYVVAAVRQELRSRFGPDADTRGLRVYTGIDPRLQGAAQQALRSGIERVEGGRYGQYRHPRPEPKSRPTGDTGEYLQGMIVAVDPENGEIRALVGGRDFALSQFDRALHARRQPGSAFKPFIYAAALADRIPITTRIATTALTVEDAGAGEWRPGDHLPDSVEALPLREAMARSSNTAAVRLGQRVGTGRVSAVGKGLGLSTPIPDYPSTFLGAAEVIPVELVAAYAAFGNGGYRVRPHLIRRIEDDQGNTLWRAPESRERGLDEGVAFLTLSMLRDVVDSGTGARAREGGYHGPAAGKTGTTNQGKDAWFIGLTPDLVAGVWLGLDQPRPIAPNASGGTVAAPVWGEFMGSIYRGGGAAGEWRAPSSLDQVAIDLESGMRATSNCPPDGVRTEYFIPGTEPRESCPLHPDNGVVRFLDGLWSRVKKIF